MTQKRPLTFALFTLRLMSGLGGGIGGALIAFLVYFGLLSFIPVEESNSLSIFITLAVGLAVTLATNILATVLVTFMDEEKYARRKTMMSHVFIFNLILFLITVPFYVLGTGLDQVLTITMIHLLLSGFISSLILEVLAGYEYALLGIYSQAMGVFLALGIGLLIVQSGINDLVFLFGTLPLTWVMLQLSSGIGEWAYDTYLKYYGLDALNSGTDLGDQEVAEVEGEIESDSQ